MAGCDEAEFAIESGVKRLGVRERRLEWLLDELDGLVKLSN